MVGFSDQEKCLIRCFSVKSACLPNLSPLPSATQKPTKVGGMTVTVTGRESTWGEIESVGCSVHAGDKLVDELLTVAPDATLLEGMSLLGEALLGAGKFEGPQEVVGFLEVSANSPDLVDKVLNAADSLLSKVLVNDGVVVESNSGSVHLAVASLVDESADGVAGGISIGDVRLHESDHVDRSAVQLHKHTVVELSQSQELHDLLLLGSQLVDTNRSPTHKLKVSYAHSIMGVSF